jgi:hypothetical protein
MTFENYAELNKRKDFFAAYTQGVFTENNNSFAFKNCFIDSVKLNVKEITKTEQDYLLYKFIHIDYKDTKAKILDLSFINYDRRNDSENQDNIYLCLIDKSGAKRYKQFDFDKGSFGDIYYENEPAYFYLKIGDDIVSEVYHIKGPRSNYFELSLTLDKREYIYHHRINYLYGTTYHLQDSFLINAASSDTFRLFNKNIETSDIRIISTEILRNIK